MNDPGFRMIKCACREIVRVAIGDFYRMNTEAAKVFPVSAPFSFKVVGFSRYIPVEGVRVVRDGRKTSETFSFSWFHDSVRHRKWEKNARRYRGGRDLPTLERPR